jgi:hypothetical protein
VATTISTKVFVSIFTTAISQLTGGPATLTKLKAPRVGRKNCHAFRLSLNHSHTMTHAKKSTHQRGQSFPFLYRPGIMLKFALVVLIAWLAVVSFV